MSLSANPWIRLLRLDRPIGILLLLWPTLWSLWLAAEGLPSFKNVMILIYLALRVLKIIIPYPFKVFLQ